MSSVHRDFPWGSPSTGRFISQVAIEIERHHSVNFQADSPRAAKHLVVHNETSSSGNAQPKVTPRQRREPKPEADSCDQRCDDWTEAMA